MVQYYTYLLYEDSVWTELPTKYKLYVLGFNYTLSRRAIYTKRKYRYFSIYEYVGYTFRIHYRPSTRRVTTWGLRALR